MEEKKQSRNIKKAPLLMGIAFIVLGCTLGITSLAWFVSPQTKQDIHGIGGEAKGSYFESGDGKSAETAYVIAKPQQLYYFNWLQDLGYFNEDNDKDGNIDTVYFKLDDSLQESGLDMTGFILPPAGSEKYPFVGNFNGNGVTISNLTISNNETNLKKTGWPNKADEEVKGSISIVGFFGIIGEYEGDAAISGYEVSANAVNDLYFDDIKIETSTDKTLVGLIAGYVNGSLQNCGVRKGYFDFQNSSVSVITNAKEDGSTKPLQGNSKLSQYSLIGAYNSNHFTWTGQPSDTTTGTDWGGSIDLSSLSKRINYIAKSANGGSKPAASQTYSAFNAKLYYSRSFNWDEPYKNGQYAAMMATTCLPLNIDLETATISVTDSSSMGTYYTNGSHTAEPVLDTNTGYIAGKGSQGGRSTPRLHSKYYTSTNSGENGINYSIYASAGQKEISSSGTKSELKIDDNSYQIYDIFQPKNISLYYVDSATGTTYRIKDNDNENQDWPSQPSGVTDKEVDDCGFGNTETGYYSVKKKFSKMLSDEQTDTLIKSNQISLNSLQMFGDSNTSTMTTSFYGSENSQIKINGSDGLKKYSSYEMLDGGINFTLKQSGSIKIILGAYASSSTDSPMPAIYKVNRSSDQVSIDSYQKIKSVYQISQSSDTYYYEYAEENSTADQIPAGSTSMKVCDLENLYAGKFKSKCAYYVEIPLNAGTYWFGSDDKQNKAAFVLYLDIGSNAGNESPTPTTETIPPIDFVYYSDAAKKTIKPINATKETTDDEGKTTTVSDYTPSKVTFDISGAPSTVYFYRVRSVDAEGKETIIMYYANTAGSSATIGIVGTGASTTSVGSKDGYEEKDTTSGS